MEMLTFPHSMKKSNLNTLFVLLVLTCLWQCRPAEKNLVFNVVTYGATGDGTTNDQKAIQQAIDACAGSGGTVLFPPGTYVTGQLILGSNMTLQVDSGARILGIQSDSEAAYPHHKIETRYPNRMLEDCQRRLIYGNRVHNVRITGKGVIDGQGDFEPWMHVKELGTEKDRPSLIAFVASSAIEVSNVTLIDPACWTQVYIECDSILLQNLKVHTGNLTPNRDGIDIVDCHFVRIEGCSIQSEDDGICFKSGSEYGCKNVVVKNCVVDKLHVNAGNCFKLGTDGLGSFMNFDVSGLTLKNAYQNSAIAIESMDGAVVDNIHIRDCEIINCGQAIFVLLANRKRTVPDRLPRIGSISNLWFQNLTGVGFTQQYPSILTGIEGHHIQNVQFTNLNFQLKGGVKTNNQSTPEYDGSYPEGSKFGVTNAHAFYIRHTDQVTFTNCKFSVDTPDKRSWLVEENVKELHLKP